jgi:hypothetical protein
MELEMQARQKLNEAGYLRFDNEQQPTRLIFDQWCASAPTNELSAAVIEF